MKYLAKLVQRNEGCDYSICCGVLFTELESETIEAAQNEVEEMIRETYSHEDERLSEATIYVATNESFSLNLTDLYQEIDRPKEVIQKEITELENKIRNLKQQL